MTKAQPAQGTGDRPEEPSEVVNSATGQVTGPLVQAGSIGGSATATGYANSGVHIGAVTVLGGAPMHDRYLHQVRRIAPAMLTDRDVELAELAAFCTDPSSAGMYLWWQGPAWSGKSALMSWFVLNPPKRIRVVSFFVTARWAGQADRAAFLDNLMEQLLALLGRQHPSPLSDATREVHVLGLLEEATQLCRGRDENLVLVVDGLDEDQGVRTGPGAHSIAAVLPSRLPDGLRVVLSGRPDPPVPADVPARHPLRDRRIVRTLVPSTTAQVLRTEMMDELKRLFYGTTAEQDLLGLVTAAGGGLTAADLAELTGLLRWQIDDHLHTVTGRSFTRRDSRYQPEDAPVYLLGHEDLQHTAVNMLGADRLRDFRARVHAWARGYRDRHWPGGTPDYLLGGYFAMLTATHDSRHMIEHATDPGRHDRMLERSGADTDALVEIATTQDLIAEQQDPDLSALVRLAIHRTRLRDRSRSLSVLATVWTHLGRFTRAEAYARADSGRGPRASMLADIATKAWATGDCERANRLLDAADAAARSGSPGPGREHALGAVVTACVRVGDLDRAQRAASAMNDPVLQAWTLAVASGRDAARGDADWLRAWVAHVLTVAAAMADDGPRCQMVISAAKITADLRDTTRTQSLLDDAEQLAGHRSIYISADDLWEAMALVADRIGDSSRVDNLIGRIDTPYRQASALYELLGRTVTRGATERATELISTSETVIRTISESHEYAQRLLWLAVPTHRNGDHATAMRLLREAIETIRWLDNTFFTDSLLCEAAQAAAQIGEFDYAETLVQAHTHPVMADSTLEWIVRNLAFAGHLDRARDLARTITLPVTRLQALVAVAVQAANGHDEHRTTELTGEAETTARRIADNIRRTEELAVLAVAAVDQDDHEQAQELLAAANRIAESITFDDDRARALAATDRCAAEIRRHSNADHPQSSESDSTSAGRDTQESSATPAHRGGDLIGTRSVQRADDAGQHDEPLHTIISALARTGDLDEAESSALTITDPGTRIQALAVVVTAAARCGAIDRAAVLLRHAQDQVESVEAPPERVRVLTALATAAATVGDRATVTEILTAARTAADFVSDEFGEPDRTQAIIAQTAELIGMSQEADAIAASLADVFVKRRVLNDLATSAAARGQLDRARTIAVRQDSGYDRTQTLVDVAGTVYSQNRVEQAEETLAQAHRSARSIIDRDEHDRALVDVAIAFASINHVDHAHTIASSVDDIDGRNRLDLALLADSDPARRARTFSRLLRYAPWHLSARELIRHHPDLLAVIRRELAALPDTDALEHRPGAHQMPFLWRGGSFR